MSLKSQKKTPKQERSQTLFNSILEATTHIFERIDFSKVSTNKIAEYAGVSIGSFYQYFADKRSVISIVIDKRLEQNRQEVKKIFARQPEGDLQDFIGFVVDQMVDHFLKQKGYLRALIYFQFELQKADKIIESRHLMAKIMADETHKRYPNLGDAQEIEKKFFYLINCAFGVVYMYSQVQSAPYEIDQVKTEMKKNILAYLNADLNAGLNNN